METEYSRKPEMCQDEQKGHAQVVNRHQAQIQVTQTRFEGPLPAPQILKGYDDIYPGAAKIIIDDFRENAKYIREANRKAIEAQIATEKRGQYMAYSILLLILIVVGISLMMGNVTFAGASGFAFLALAAINFLKLNNSSKDNKKNG